MAMFKACQAQIVKVDPTLCGNRSVGSTVFKCTGHCAGCFGKCRSIRTAQVKENKKEVCEVDPNYLYVHVKALHGMQRCEDKDHPGYGQLTGNFNGDAIICSQSV